MIQKYEKSVADWHGDKIRVRVLDTSSRWVEVDADDPGILFLRPHEARRLAKFLKKAAKVAEANG